MGANRPLWKEQCTSLNINAKYYKYQIINIKPAHMEGQILIEMNFEKIRY